MPNAGQIIRALDFTTAVVDSQATSGTTTSTSYTATLTSGTACGVSFTAPTSGMVVIHNVCEMSNSGANDNRCGWALKTGSVVGSGTSVTAADDARAIHSVGTSAIRVGTSVLVTGLTAGSSYNVQQQFKVSAGTGTFVNKSLSVTPVP